MSTLILECVGKLNGREVYAPIDSEGEKLIDGQLVIACDIKSGKAKRTTLQNASIHLYGSLVAQAMNDGGITKKIYFDAKQVDCEWTRESVIEDVWREIQNALYDHRKTSKLDRDQVSKVYDQVSRILAENFNVRQEFPSRFNGMYDAET